jgi:AcrR family transcriptional regulator
MDHLRPPEESVTRRPDAGERSMSTSGAPASSYRRTAGTPRGLARKEALLQAVTDDLATEGLADFSLRRAARAASTTHKVLLYHFAGAEDLLAQALVRLRQRRIDNVLGSVADGATLADRVRALWPVLADDATGLRVIDQAIGLAMYDPQHYAHLAQDAADAYLEPLFSLCPPQWPATRRREVAEMIMATMRGFLMEWRTTRDDDRIQAGLAALLRALEREEAAEH